MVRYAMLYQSQLDSGYSILPISEIPEFVKNHPEASYRAPFFFSTNDIGQINDYLKGKRIPLFGPFQLIFNVKRARDILLDPCLYAGLDVSLSVAGKKLPQLPQANELEALLSQENSFVLINEKPYKPLDEVFGFQQVYEDCVKSAEALKRLAIPSAVATHTITYYATPDEISLEVHPGILGLEGREDLESIYFKILTAVTDIKEVNGRLQKNSIKTVVTQAYSAFYRILLPGSINPVFHRSKVAVGATQFAYGVAAFSDHCAKKRSRQESVAEANRWLQFVEREMSPIPGIRDKLVNLKMGTPIVLDTPRPVLVASPSIVPQPKPEEVSYNVFKPLKHQIESELASLSRQLAAFPAPFASLNKSLGGGFAVGGVHLLVGARESGKANMLLQQALLTQQKKPVLFISFEHNLREFCIRAAACSSLIPATDLQISDNLKAPFANLQTKISEKFYFSGIDAQRSSLDVDEIEQLAEMIPGNDSKLVVIESLSEGLISDNKPLFFAKLKTLAKNKNLTFIISLHSAFKISKRPNFVELDDLQLLEKFQSNTDSIILFNTDRSNLRRFVAMLKGQIDPGLLAKLEQKALQLSGNKRLKSDTYIFLKTLHTRSGKRELMLALYQPEFSRFFEIAVTSLLKG